MIDLRRALYDKRLPKNLFKIPLDKVDTIRWVYKIAHDTADFRHGDEIKEIQILSVTFKDGKIDKSELVAIQKAAPHPILFTAYDKWYMVIDGEPFDLSADRQGARQLLDGNILLIERRSAKLTDLYEDLAAQFIPIDKRPSESITDTVARYKRLQTLEREIDTMQRKVDNEKQTNKRFEYNEQLKRLRAELEGVK